MTLHFGLKALGGDSPQLGSVTRNFFPAVSGDSIPFDLIDPAKHFFEGRGEMAAFLQAFKQAANDKLAAFFGKRKSLLDDVGGRGHVFNRFRLGGCVKKLQGKFIGGQSTSSNL
jgi:hypothetical protein